MEILVYDSVGGIYAAESRERGENSVWKYRVQVRVPSAQYATRVSAVAEGRQTYECLVVCTECGFALRTSGNGAKRMPRPLVTAVVH